MTHNYIGKTGLRVSPIMFGEDDLWYAGRQEGKMKICYSQPLMA